MMSILQFLVFAIFTASCHLKEKSFVDKFYQRAEEIELILKNEKIVNIQTMEKFLLSKNEVADFEGGDRILVGEIDGKNILVVIRKRDSIDEVLADKVAYEVAKKTKLALIHPVTIREIDGELTSVQLFDQRAEIITNEAEIYKVSKVAFEEMMIFNFIIGQWDTGIHNFLLAEHGGIYYPIAIDYESIFHKQYVKYGHLPFVQRCRCDVSIGSSDDFLYQGAPLITQDALRSLQRKCYNCHEYLRRPGIVGNKYVIFNGGLFVQNRFGMNIKLRKCSRQTVTKVELLTEDFIKRLLDDSKIINKKSVMLDILGRKAQFLNYCSNSPSQ